MDRLLIILEVSKVYPIGSLYCAVLEAIDKSYCAIITFKSRYFKLEWDIRGNAEEIALLSNEIKEIDDRAQAQGLPHLLYTEKVKDDE